MPRVVKKPEERRQEILQAARTLFLTKQYEKTTIQDVLDKLNIAKGTFYHYFPSKEALLDGVIELMVEEHLAKIRQAFEKSHGTALKRLEAVFTAARVSEEQQTALEQLHQPGNVLLHTRQLAVTFMQMAPLVAELIEQGCAEGVFETEYPLEVAELLLSGIQFITDVGIYPWKPEDLLRRARAIPHLVEAQLHAATGTFHFLLDSL